MKRTLAALILIVSSILFLQSCMVLNPSKRQPLSLTEFSKSFPQQGKTFLVQLTPAVPGKPLDETIWTNIQGPIWDPRESGQIGFVQDYEFMPVPTPSGATAATRVRGTQIFIPFGNAFATMFKSAVTKSFSGSSVCFTETCASGKDTEFDTILSISIDYFVVYESPSNHINFGLKVTSQVQTGKKNPISKESAYTLKGFKLGSALSTSYSVIDKMNEALNQFTEEVVADQISRAVMERP